MQQGLGLTRFKKKKFWNVLCGLQTTLWIPSSEKRSASQTDSFNLQYSSQPMSYPVGFHFSLIVVAEYWVAASDCGQQARSILCSTTYSSAHGAAWALDRSHRGRGYSYHRRNIHLRVRKFLYSYFYYLPFSVLFSFKFSVWVHADWCLDSYLCRDAVLDIVLQIAEALSLADEFATQLASNQKLFSLACQVIRLSHKDEVRE